MLLNKGVLGAKIIEFDHQYLRKEKYFEKQYRRKDTQNDVLNNMQFSKFRKMAPIRS